MLGTQAVRGDTVLAAPSPARKVVRLLRLAWSAPREPWARLGCQRDPFAAEPDPAEFFATPTAQKVNTSLLAALQIGDGGLFLVTGEAGVGKTMLLRVVERTLQDAGEQVSFHADAASGDWQDELDRIAASADVDRPILVVDGAELCDAAAINRLEQLFEARGDRARAVRLVIGGRPEIEQRLRRLVATALGTKVTFARLRLDPLDPAVVGDFIRYRLNQAGAQRTEPFSTGVLQCIGVESGGNPRRILELCNAELGPAPVAVPPAVVSVPRAGRLSGKRLALLATTVAALVAVGGAVTLSPRTHSIEQAVTPAVAEAAPAPAAEVLAAVEPAAGKSEPVSEPAPAPAPTPVVYAMITLADVPARLTTSAAGTADRGMRTRMPGPLSAISGDVSAGQSDSVVPPFELPGLIPVPPPAPVVAPLTPVAVPAVPPPAPRLPAEAIAELLARGDAYLAAGDLVSARLFYERAADGGDGQAALVVGQTFDPAVMARLGLRGARGDAAKAAEWYRRALALGTTEADRLLRNLETR
jgi:type II secretory pathway predicted ATPase ExeA